MTPGERGQALLASLRSRGYSGEVGLHIITLDGQLLATLDADVVFPAASTIKVPLLLLALERVQAGELDLHERFELRAEDRVGGAGVLHELGAGLRPSLQDLLTLMIIVSDNTATNLVIDRLGIDAVNAWLDEQGCCHTRLVGKLQLPPEQHNPAQRRGERNRTTASEQVHLLIGLWQGERLDSAHRGLALSVLGRQQYRDILARPLPTDIQGAPLYQTYTKSGELVGVHHDVGLLLLPRGLCVALLSRGGGDQAGHPDNRDTIALSDTLYPLLAVLGKIYERGHGDI